MTTSTTSRFQVGQVVKHITSGRTGSRVVPVTVQKVWRNGVIQVADYRTGCTYSTHTFHADGSGRGSYRYRIEPMAEGETAQQLIAANEAKDKARREEEERKAAEEAQLVIEWWEAEGQKMWDARLNVGPFLDQDAFIIRYSRNGQEYMPFVVVGYRKTFDEQEEVTLTVGGLIGNEYRDPNGQVVKTVSTFSSCSSGSYKTLREALYSITH